MAKTKKNLPKKKQPKTDRTPTKRNPNGQAGQEHPVAVTTKVSPRPDFIVGVGASAGGLEAFEQLLSSLSTDTNMAFVLVQHLAPTHESFLSELLAKSSRMPVLEVTEGMTVAANHIYVIPPNAQMHINEGVLRLSPLGTGGARRMPIDTFLHSLAEDQQSRAIGVILSGTASDGTLGIQAIKAAGGVTFAQDEESAKYGAMPRSAIAAGNVDFVLRPEEIARELSRIAKQVHFFTRDEVQETAESGAKNETLAKIYALLRNFSRVDFNHYKPGTIKRRITRRMFLRKIDNLEGYFQFLRKNRDEVENLFNDVLINVTGFFRDPDAFESLVKEAFPLMMKNKSPDVPIRIWVPGCSTGEEAYSIAIALLEFLGDRVPNLHIQIFGTDISESIIQKARAGIYPEHIEADLSGERLQRFFQRADGGYKVKKAVRDICIFAKQDIGKDPPFSRLDMVSCRNVMIYMGPVLQKRIIPIFHYALNTGGILFLGSSETVGGFSDLFTSLDKKSRLYIKRTVDMPAHFDFVPRFAEPETPKVRPEPVGRTHLQKTADQMLLTRFIPASVVVNDEFEIVQFFGQTGRFLEPTAGDASLNLLKMVKSGLQVELRLALNSGERG
jgi:two-component system CheB/CheR fusion protein